MRNKGKYKKKDKAYIMFSGGKFNANYPRNFNLILGYSEGGQRSQRGAKPRDYSPNIEIGRL